MKKLSKQTLKTIKGGSCTGTCYEEYLACIAAGDPVAACRLERRYCLEICNCGGVRC